MKTYATTDLYLSAFLKSNNMKIVSKEVAGRRTTFVFEDSPRREALVQDFYNNALINNFVHSLQDLKAIVYNY